MKVLVISDNHGDAGILTRLFADNRQRVDAIFHCGDSELKAQNAVFDQVYSVKGNNDIGQQFPVDVTVSFSDERIYMTHGDRYQVNFGLTNLSLRAREVHATMCFFGHTHQLLAEVADGVLYLNPGSISLPRGEYAKIGGTYTIVTASAAAFDVDFYDRNQRLIEELHQHFDR